MNRTNATKTNPPSPRATWIAAVCALALLPALAAAQPAPAGRQVELPLAKGSKLWLEGTSTLHPYKIDAAELHAHMTLVPAAQGASATPQDLEALARSNQLKVLELSIPVTQLRSTEGGMMDKNTWQTLKAAQQPIIRFRLDSYELGAATARLTGRLSMAGAEKPITLDVHVLRDSQGLRIIGSKEVLMSDYGIKAPVLMMGTLKVGNKVTVHFDLRPQVVL